MITSGRSLGNDEAAEHVETKIDLFQQKKFTSHAGIPMEWKIEMDALSDKEWDCLAKMIMGYEIRPFSKVVGIPRGGLKLQHALEKYISSDENDPVLIVDDVWTTGMSFREFLDIQVIESMIASNGWFGWTIFARSETSDNVNALFQMPNAAWAR